MKIKYSEEIDKKMFFEVNKMRKKLSPIFGFEFPKVKFDKRLVPIAKTMAEVGETFLKEKEIKKLKKIIKKIFNKDLPELTIYINTTPFSSWNLKERYLTISYTRNNFLIFFSTVCHESNHLMYDLVFKTKKYEDIKIKEIITVLNNYFNVKDKGWRIFSKEREKAFDFYKKNKNFEKTLKFTKSMLI